MTSEDPKLALLKRLNFSDLDSCAELFTEDFVWHYFNPRLPDIAGDYRGVSGLKAFFKTMSTFTDGTFVPQTISVVPWGDELLLMCNKNRMTLQGIAIETDVVLVWRIVDGRISEVWDIPSVFSSDHGSVSHRGWRKRARARGHPPDQSVPHE